MTHLALLTPPTPTAALARELVEKWSSPSLVNHCLRSWAWGRRLAENLGLDYDSELLYVAAMLHDLGVVPQFDAVAVPFEDAGGAVAWAFAAGAGWPPARRTRVEEVIQRHAWAVVDPEDDAEGYLLEAATSIDVSGSGAEKLDRAFIVDVGRTVPRFDFAREFTAAVHEQAHRKPGSEAARFDAGGGIARGEAFWQSILG
jgi:HD superfamily phosphodiesterase